MLHPRVLISIFLVLCGCGDSSTDLLDANVPDARASDAATPDTALQDTGAADAAPDATPDAIPRDAGATIDAGGRGFQARYALGAEYPESGLYDERAHRFFVGSLGDGAVRTVDAETGAEETYFAEAAAGPWWTLGMDIDTERRRLWVCAMRDLREISEQDPPYDGFLWVFDLDTQERIANHALSDAMPAATCTDVALAADGTAYVVDREHPIIYRATFEGGAEIFAEDELLAGGLVGQNALVVLPDQSGLLSAVYLPSRLVYIGLGEGGDAGEIRAVEIDGSFADATPLSGADGMVYFEGAAYVIFASEIVRVQPTLATWTHATASELTVPNGMTDAIITPGGLYLVNGQSIRFALGTSPDPFALVRFDGRFE
ncbi:MAG: hypothetical protein ACI9KE_001738 [Polyangiales bacterium]|jgi:hypothetical protein